MANFTLTLAPKLGGFATTIAGTKLSESVDLAIVAVAQPIKGAADLKSAVKNAYGVSMPKPNLSVTAKKGGARIISTQPDQIFVVFDHAKPDAAEVVENAINSAGYVTDQTDGWIGLELSGPLALAALERICPIDLDISVFPVHASARTTMEHLGVLMVRTDKDAFLLMSSSSSAESFLHAVETSLHYVS